MAPWIFSLVNNKAITRHSHIGSPIGVFFFRGGRWGTCGGYYDTVPNDRLVQQPQARLEHIHSECYQWSHGTPPVRRGPSSRLPRGGILVFWVGGYTLRLATIQVSMAPSGRRWRMIQGRQVKDLLGAPPKRANKAANPRRACSAFQGALRREKEILHHRVQPLQPTLLV